ncbi:S8 family serine peptidase [Methylophaga sp.]|uniref:S8 family serine peptidase n=1 Tax=Methylophaga sp. TaxID=2024840 RepID=UPI001400DA84|nr:S8 family serine peptidase [Methylophaga sp.]MTI63500.1 hypothetical protein [Methylophaga sp.]
MRYGLIILAGLLIPLTLQAGATEPAGRPTTERPSEPTSSPPAQRQGLSQPPAPARRPTVNAPLPETGSYRLDQEGCIAGKQISVIFQTGQTPPNHQWYLKTPESMARLTAKLTGYGQLRLLVPGSLSLTPMQAYPLYFKSSAEHSLSYTGQTVFFCPEQTETTAKRAGELLILVPQMQLDFIVQQLEQQGLTVAEQSPLLAGQVLLTLRGHGNQWAQQQRQKLRQLFPDLIIDFNDYYAPAASPRLYARDILNWPEAGCLQAAKGTIKVGIIDSVVDNTHPSLQDRAVFIEHFVSPVEVDSDHATIIAVILTGNNRAAGHNGLLTEAALYSASVVEMTEYGEMASVSAIVRALHWLHQQQVRLVNLSLAGSQANIVLESVLKYARRQGMLIFAAAGNEGRKQPAYPAAFESVFAVTAVDPAERLYALANQGEFIDFAAPGVDVWTASGQYRSGTSYAVPHAVAVTAVLLQVNPVLPAELVYESLRRLSKDLGAQGHDEKYGWGLLQYPQQFCQ